MGGDKREVPDLVGRYNRDGRFRTAVDDLVKIFMETSFEPKDMMMAVALAKAIYQRERGFKTIEVIGPGGLVT